ncbi:MAG: S8 family serine peptidase, partial [Anaerolineales bacterium]|nr:S8 family serine peptidase [Anaerolineales bacterium]
MKNERNTLAPENTLKRLNLKQLCSWIGKMVFALGLFIVLSSYGASSTAAEDDFNCEIIISQSEGQTVYALRPDLSPEEQKLCRQQIKQQSVRTWEAQQARQFVPGQVLVKFKPGVNEFEKKQVIARYGITRPSQRNSGRSQIVRVKVAAGSEQQALNSLNADRLVEYAEPNYYAKASDSPTWGQAAIQAPLAWTAAACDPGAGVAVIDTGINLEHMEFSAGNAHYGWNYIAGAAEAADDNGHGTHVASTVGGATVGICPNTTIVAYKVLDADGNGTYADIASAILEAAADPRVRIINLSLGGFNTSSTLQDAVDQAAASGKLVIAAAGNGLGQYPEYPARYASAISIGAVDADWRLTTWSTRQAGAEARSLVAPGVDIHGADYTCSTCYITKSGTSMATPHTAGAAALVWSTDSGLTASQVKGYLLDNTLPLGDEIDYGQGGLNIAAAVKAAGGAAYNLPPIVTWPIPWPGLTSPNNQVKILARLEDLDGSVAAANATITLPGGGSATVPMVLNSESFWEAAYTPTVQGDYTVAAITANDGTDSASGLSGGVTFHVVGENLASGWPQLGQGASGGGYIPVNIDITTGEQLYTQYNNLGSNTVQGAQCLSGRCDVPAAVRITGSIPCPLGDNWGRRWTHAALLGVYQAYTVLYDSTLELGCYDGIGVFNDTGAIGGQLLTMDEGGTRTDTQNARLHNFDPLTGRQYWLTQLGYYSGDGVKLSEDGQRAYTIHGSGGLWAVNAITGERLWNAAGSFNAPPVESGGRVFANRDGVGVLALDAQTGLEIWRYPSLNKNFIGTASPAVSPDGETLIVCDGSSSVYALAASDGGLVWSSPVGSGYCYSTPAITPAGILQYTRGTDNQNHLFRLSLTTGEVLADTVVTTFGSSWASPAVVGDLVFLADYSGGISAYRLPSLERVWQQTVDPYSISSWQTSVQYGQDENGPYVLVLVSSNNGYYRAWRFRTIETDPTPPADFDGDGDTDISVYRPSNGYWYAYGQTAVWWGASSDRPVPGDYDADGTTDKAFFRPSNGYWYVRDGAAYTAAWWGQPGDIPVPGDYDGDGGADLAIVRPSNGYWYVREPAITQGGYYQNGDIPVPCDYDGDGDDDIAVYRPSNGYWYVLGQSATWWGTATDIPLPGDYDGDGACEFAFWRPSNGYWYVRDGASYT